MEVRMLTGLGAGDSSLIYHILSQSLSERCRDIEFLEKEIQFGLMTHRGKAAARTVAIQGDYTIDGDIPLYRTPGDHLLSVSQWTETVAEIRRELMEYFQEKEPEMVLNHVKMQLYQNGEDYITKHSDKTIDIQRGTKVINLNLGVMRHFTIENKVTGEVISYEFPHNSVFVLGWNTNKYWTHCVKKDKSITEKRISLAFRMISTWITPTGQLYGQGARRKTREELMSSLTLQLEEKDDDSRAEYREETRKMLEAFSRENGVIEEIDGDDIWDRLYAEGFDCCDLSALNT